MLQIKVHPTLENRLYQHTMGSNYVLPASCCGQHRPCPLSQMPVPFLQRLFQEPIPRKALSTSDWGLGAVYVTPWAIWLLRKSPFLWSSSAPCHLMIFINHLYETLGQADLRSGFDPSGIRGLAEAARLTLFFLNITRAARGTRTRG